MIKKMDELTKEEKEYIAENIFYNLQSNYEGDEDINMGNVLEINVPEFDMKEKEIKLCKDIIKKMRD